MSVAAATLCHPTSFWAVTATTAPFNLPSVVVAVLVHTQGEPSVSAAEPPEPARYGTRKNDGDGSEDNDDVNDGDGDYDDGI